MMKDTARFLVRAGSPTLDCDSNFGCYPTFRSDSRTDLPHGCEATLPPYHRANEKAAPGSQHSSKIRSPKELCRSIRHFWHCAASFNIGVQKPAFAPVTE